MNVLRNTHGNKFETIEIIINVVIIVVLNSFFNSPLH